MRILKLLLVPLVASTAGSLVPASAHAAKIPICIEKRAGILCYYAVDQSDCLVLDGQEYCRTIALYRWDV